MAHNEPADFHPFDLIDDGLVLAILRCLVKPESLGRAALVCKRLAELCKEPFIWRPLLDSELPSSGEGFLALPSEGAGWRERYKQWHTIGSLTWSHCQLAASSAQPSARFQHCAVAVSANCAYVYGGRDAHSETLDELWMLCCDSAATGTATWELVAQTSEQTPTARFETTLSPVSLSVVIFGGMADRVFFSSSSYLDEVLSLNVRMSQWTLHECVES